MKGISKQIESMEWGNSPTRGKENTMGNGKMEPSMEKAPMCTPMETLMLGGGDLARGMARAPTTTQVQA